MVTELDIQAKIIKSVKNLGGYGFKTDSKHIAGLPDLFLSMINVGGAFVEVKFLPTIKSSLTLTVLQRDTLRRMQSAGMSCGWLAVVKIDQDYALYASNDHQVLRLHQQYFLMNKLKGTEWPIPAIILAMRPPVT
jgi:hypothetical protein